MKRRAFTLVELLVVIAILGILIGLIVVVLAPVLGWGAKAKTQVEIGSMDAAVKAFKTKFDRYPPSIATIPPIQPGGPTGIQVLDQNTWKLFQKMYPAMNQKDWLTFCGKVKSYYPNPEALKGDQCLVFFLSGFGGKGFSANPNDPLDFNANLTPAKFFTFEPARLKVNPNNGVSSKFPSYVDPFQQIPPVFYAFFSGDGQTTPWRTNDCISVKGNQSGPTGNPNPPANPQPYFNGKSNTDTFVPFQIISAGPDGNFGVGGAIVPGTTLYLLPRTMI